MRVDAHTSSGHDVRREWSARARRDRARRAVLAERRRERVLPDRNGERLHRTGRGATTHIENTTADYGSIPAGAIANCYDASAAHDCYRVTGSTRRRAAPRRTGTRPSRRTLDGDGAKIWTLHVGDSFSDVPRSQPFYTKIETLLHTGITTGCTPTTVLSRAPRSSRDQMAIFIAKGIAGAGPSSCRRRDSSAPAPTTARPAATRSSPTSRRRIPFCKHVHYLAAQNVTLGCTADSVLPDGQTITRDAMASFIAKADRRARRAARRADHLRAGPGDRALLLLRRRQPEHRTSRTCRSPSPFCKHVHYLWATRHRRGLHGDARTARASVGHPRRDGEVPRERLRAPALRAVSGPLHRRRHPEDPATTDPEAFRRGR